MQSVVQALPYFLQQVINGLILGAIYGLVAIGYTMVYGIVGMINFAHGEIFMIGGYCAVIGILLAKVAGIGWVPMQILAVLLFSMMVTAAYGWTLERVAYRPLRRSFRLAPLISAIGASIFLQNFVQLAQGAEPKAIKSVLPGTFVLLRRADGFTVTISSLEIVILVLTAGLMIGLSLIIGRTSLGRAQRACAQDAGMAALLGVDVNRTISTTFVMGAALAAVAGTMVALKYGVVDFTMGFVAGVKAFTAAVLGGIGSLPGAVLGGLAIGLVEALWSGYVSAEYKDVAAFTILILILLVRPSGLLGRPEVEKV